MYFLFILLFLPPMWPLLRHPRRLHCRASASEPLAGCRAFVGTLSLLLLSLLLLLALPFLVLLPLVLLLLFLL
jgi:hypothetical protein